MSQKRFHRRIRVQVSVYDEPTTRYVDPEDAPSIEKSLIAEAVSTGKRRARYVKSRLTGEPILATARLLRRDGSPVCLGLRKKTDGSEFVIAISGQKTNNFFRVIRSVSAHGLHGAFTKCVKRMAKELRLNTSQVDTLYESFPAFCRRYGDPESTT